jgi:hypothetical protein
VEIRYNYGTRAYGNSYLASSVQFRSSWKPCIVKKNKCWIVKPEEVSFELGYRSLSINIIDINGYYNIYNIIGYLNVLHFIWKL